MNGLKRFLPLAAMAALFVTPAVTQAGLLTLTATGPLGTFTVVDNGLGDTNPVLNAINVSAADLALLGGLDPSSTIGAISNNPGDIFLNQGSIQYAANLNRSLLPGMQTYTIMLSQTGFLFPTPTFGVGDSLAGNFNTANDTTTTVSSMGGADILDRLNTMSTATASHGSTASVGPVPPEPFATSASASFVTFMPYSITGMGTFTLGTDVLLNVAEATSVVGVSGGPVPEPASLLLAVLSLPLVGSYRLMRKNRRQ